MGGIVWNRGRRGIMILYLFGQGLNNVRYMSERTHRKRPSFFERLRWFFHTYAKTAKAYRGSQLRVSRELWCLGGYRQKLRLKNVPISDVLTLCVYCLERSLCQNFRSTESRRVLPA